MPVTELSLGDVELIFEPDFVRQLRSIYLCGNYGDPMVARDTLDVLSYFRRCHPKVWLGIYTNGSGRTTAWWERLAGLVDYCRFSIDGLRATNHLYRRGTNWDIIMQSVGAFINAGGNAEWDFIVFQHNEHQVEEARALSRSLGFTKFAVKKTYRFFNLKTGRKRDQVEVLDRDGNFEYSIAGPTQSRYQNESLVQLDRNIGRQSNYDDYLDKTRIVCKVAGEQKLYLSAEGLAFPCCWTANIYPWYQPPQATEIWQLINRLPNGKDSLNARKQPLSEIVNGPFFQHLVPESWSIRSVAEGRLEVCSRVCGEIDLYSAQYTGATNETRT
jgi:MoaA/NifB/PqqE/SkfB family radical SAM enzyme